MPIRCTWHFSRFAAFVSETPSLSNSASAAVRLGYVALVDCAPIAVARECGIFSRYQLNVKLSRELGWASVRDKIRHGELDASQSIAGIAFALTLGAEDQRCDVSVPMVLNAHGNAITLSSSLPADEIGAGDGLAAWLRRHWKKDRPFTLAATHRHSSHHILLCQWLRRHQLRIPEDVEIIFLPPPLMAGHLKAGHIDGYCVGEPWNSDAVLSGAGWCPVTSAELSYGHPEKILLLANRFANQDADAAKRLVAALIDACELCQSPEFREDLVSILSQKPYTKAPRELLFNSLGPSFFTGTRQIPTDVFHIFHGDEVNAPSVEKASWVLSGLRANHSLTPSAATPLSAIYRGDWFSSACALRQGKA